MVILKLSGQREVNIILSEFGLGVTKEQLLKIYDYATKEKFSPLVIDLEAPPEERFIHTHHSLHSGISTISFIPFLNRSSGGASKSITKGENFSFVA